MKRFWFFSTIVLLVLLTVSIMIIFSGGRKYKVDIHPVIEKVKEIGELHFFQIYFKDIIVETKPFVTNPNLAYLNFFVSEKKMILLVEFLSEFKIDLMEPAFAINVNDEDGYVEFLLPRIKYTVNIKDLRFIDEQNARILPFLLPGFLSTQIGFTVDERNEIISQAKRSVELSTRNYLRFHKKEIHQALYRAVSSLAAGFGYTDVRIAFSYETPRADGIQTRDLERIFN